MLEFLKSNWEFVSAFIVALTGLIVKLTDSFDMIKKFIKWLLTPFTILSKLNSGLSQLVKQVSEIKSDVIKIQSDVESIKKELKTNGGSSIKDTIIQIRDIAYLASVKTNLGFDGSQTALFECEPTTGKCIYSNKKLQELFGMTADEFLENGWLSALHPDDIQHTWEVWINSLQKNLPYKVRYRVINKISKRQFEVESSATAIKNPKGEILTIWGEVIVINDKNFDD